MISRRAFLKGGAVGAGGRCLFTKFSGVIRRGCLPRNPRRVRWIRPTIPKYAMPLVIPPAMPRTIRQG